MKIGTVCELYKECTICKVVKYYKEFGKKSAYKRRGICRKCFKVKQRLNSKIPTLLNYKDRVLKQGAIIKVQLLEGEGYNYKITYEHAMTLVNEGLAYIIDDTKIYKPFTDKTIRRMIFERDSCCCFYCGKPGDTLDHIKPISAGGMTTFSNCVTSCLSCNQKKGSLDFYDFINIVNSDLVLERLRDSESLIINRKLGIIHLLLRRVSEQISNLYDDSTDNEEITLKKLIEVEKEVYKIKELIKKSNIEFGKTMDGD